MCDESLFFSLSPFRPLSEHLSCAFVFLSLSPANWITILAVRALNKTCNIYLYFFSFPPPLPFLSSVYNVIWQPRARLVSSSVCDGAFQFTCLILVAGHGCVEDIRPVNPQKKGSWGAGRGKFLPFIWYEDILSSYSFRLSSFKRHNRLHCNYLLRKLIINK